AFRPWATATSRSVVSDQKTMKQPTRTTSVGLILNLMSIPPGSELYDGLLNSLPEPRALQKFFHRLWRLARSRSSMSWLEQIVTNGLLSQGKLTAIIAEPRELCWIVAASIKTARHSVDLILRILALDFEIIRFQNPSVSMSHVCERPDDEWRLPLPISTGPTS